MGTSVDLNIDMVGRIDPDRKYGDSTNYNTPLVNKLSSDLLPISDSISSKYICIWNSTANTMSKDPNGFYYRSDHLQLCQNGVPGNLLFQRHAHADHRPTDTVDKDQFQFDGEKS